jgi:hypothetical protein
MLPNKSTNSGDIMDLKERLKSVTDRVSPYFAYSPQAAGVMVASTKASTRTLFDYLREYTPPQSFDSNENKPDTYAMANASSDPMLSVANRYLNDNSARNVKDPDLRLAFGADRFSQSNYNLYPRVPSLLPNQSPAINLVRSGTEAYIKGHYNTSIKAYQQAILQDPERKDIYQQSIDQARSEQAALKSRLKSYGYPLNVAEDMD